MALNIGTLVGYLQLDDTNFARKADNADRKINALKLHLEALAKENPKISVEVATQTAQLDELKVKFADLKAKAAEGVDVRVDAVEALIEIDRVQARIRELHGKTITVDADTKPAERKISALNGLWTTILGLGPTLVPIAGAATLGISAIGAAALSAAGAVGVLKLAFAGMGSAMAAYGSYKTAMTKATTPAQRLAAQTTLNASAYGHMSPEGQRFARFAGQQIAPGGAIFKMRGAAQASVLPGVMAGARAAMPALPMIDRTISAIGGAVGGEVAAAGKALNDPFWQHFFAWLGREAPKDIKLFGSIFGNVIEGILRYLQRFAPDGRKLLQWVDDAAKKFNGWTAGKGLTDFMATLHQDAGPVLAFLQPFVKLIPELLGGFNSTGMAELSTMGLILKAIATLPPGMISFLARTLPLVVLAVKAIALATKLWAAAQAVLNFVMDANPVMLAVIAVAALTAAVILAYEHSATFRRIVVAAFMGIVAAVKVLGTWGRWLWNNVYQPVLKLIVQGVSLLLNTFGHMLTALGHVPGFGWATAAGKELEYAAGKANDLANAIGKIPTHKQSTISIDVVRTVHGVVHSSGGGHTALDPGQHHASGGWSRGAGSGTSDSIMSWLSNGEFTVNAASAAANGPLLEAVNRSHGALRVGDYGSSGRRSVSRGPVRFVIENWQTGEGYMRDIASSEDAANHRHLSSLAGMQPA